MDSHCKSGKKKVAEQRLQDGKEKVLSTGAKLNWVRLTVKSEDKVKSVLDM